MYGLFSVAFMRQNPGDVIFKLPNELLARLDWEVGG